MGHAARVIWIGRPRDLELLFPALLRAGLLLALARPTPISSAFAWLLFRWRSKALSYSPAVEWAQSRSLRLGRDLRLIRSKTIGRQFVALAVGANHRIDVELRPRVHLDGFAVSQCFKKHGTILCFSSYVWGGRKGGIRV